MATQKKSTKLRNSMAKAHAKPRPRLGNGQHQPRKLYPRITAEQRKSGLAPKMEAFINKNRTGLEAAGNAQGVLDSQNRLSHSSKGVNGSLKSNWVKAEKAASRGRPLANVIKNRQMSAKNARKAIVGAHMVSFGADPKNK